MLGFVRRIVRRPEFIGGLVGIVGFAWYQRFGIVNPTNVNAFIAGDWGTHMMGWLQYRHSPLWSLPLGQVPPLGYPLGTSMIYTDSIPLIGVILRPFSALLPTDFQYLGMWLLAGYILQGAFGARIASRFLTSKVAIAASAALFVAMPAFLIRAVHPALTAQWIILAVIAAALGTARRTRWGLVALVSVTALIQPYLWMFVLVMLFGLLIDDVRRGPARWRDALISATSASAASIALLALVGAFSSGYQPATAGFGLTGQANALALIADNEMSHVFDFISLPVTQSEGIAFLGVGVFLLLAIAAILLLARRRRWTGKLARILHTRWPLVTVGASVLLFIYALSSHVFVRGREVLDLSWMYHSILPLAERFRTSGRAVWPLMYFIVAFAIAALRRSLNGWVKNPERVAAAILVACATVQVVDLRISNRYDALRSYFFSQGAEYYVPRLEDPRWKLMDDGGYRHMAAVPTALYGCTGPLPAEGYYSGRIALLSLEAYRADLTFNSGYFSRLRTGVAESCAAQNAAAANHLDSDTVYIFMSDSVPPAESTCDLLDDIRVCVTSTNDDVLARSLRS